MPRRSSRGRAASHRRSPMRNPPQTARPAPPPAPVQGGGGSDMGGTGSTIAEGMAFGTGSAVAHRAVDAVIQHETVASSAPAATFVSW